MSSGARDLLAAKLYRFCCDAIGAPEHLQIAEQLLAAKKFVVDRSAATELREAIDVSPWAVEQNLDLIERPAAAEWYEWNLPTRAGHGGGERAVTGCLVLPHPDIESVVMMITGWIGEKRIARHSYGSAMVDLSDLKAAAYHARNGYSENAEDSIERMMEQIGLAVPLGFQDEIAIMFNRSEGAMEGILRDSSAEIPLVLAMMIARRARGGLIEEQCDGFVRLKSGPTVEPDFVERVSVALTGRGHTPFVRTVGLAGGIRLRWAGV